MASSEKSNQQAEKPLGEGLTTGADVTADDATRVYLDTLVLESLFCRKLDDDGCFTPALPSQTLVESLAEFLNARAGIPNFKVVRKRAHTLLERRLAAWQQIAEQEAQSPVPVPTVDPATLRTLRERYEGARTAEIIAEAQKRQRERSRRTHQMDPPPPASSRASEWQPDPGVELLQHALRVAGSPQRLAQWMQTPIPALNGRTPYAMMQSEEGRKQVEDVLGRIEHGVF